MNCEHGVEKIKITSHFNEEGNLKSAPCQPCFLKKQVEAKRCSHGIELEKIESHFINWLQWRHAQNQTAVNASAPCDTCFMREQVNYYKQEFEKATERASSALAEANIFRTTMYALESSTRLSIHAINHLNKSIDNASLDEVMQMVEIHQHVMEIYMEGARRKASKIDIKASLIERKKKGQEQDKIDTAELIRKQTEKRARELNAAAKKSLTPEERATEKIVENYMKITKSTREAAMEWFNKNLKK